VQTAEIRRRFLAHFEARGHTVVPSASLIAKDPTLLLVNAGMVPFKPYFLGEETPAYQRATSVQKVVRTVDIDNVGRTARHASFFQMCGNFSFGDYFKAGAIEFAWDLLTDTENGYGFDPEKLWATVYLDDDEAAELWLKYLPAERIQRRGKEDNYWSMGVPGPCGPCSEIYFDRGPEFGQDGGPEADEERYLEVWNLVFMQFERGPGPGYEYPILGDLPSQNIDTGMGLERMATILQGVDNLYEIDISKPVLDRAAQLTGRTYGEAHRADVSLRVIADHSRTAAMLIADGVTPSNEGRGYVLRRMLRRAIYNARLLGADAPIMGDLFTVVRDVMGPIYPELVSDFTRINGYAVAEEAAFLSTLRTGSTLFDTAVQETKASGQSMLPGHQAFQLHDTYGFPIDLTLDLAREQGLEVDEKEFRRLMTEQQERAKSDRKGRGIGHADVTAYRSVLEDGGETVFTGYQEIEREATVRGILGGHGGLAAATEGDEIEVVLDATPFYAEGGGQQADHGRIVFDGGELEVFDVTRPVPDLIVHRVRVLRGELTVGTGVQALIDVERRRAISRSHTATHLVHRAFRGALGESATQAGSENSPGRLRFDFANPSAVPPGVLQDVEDEVNEILLQDLEVRDFITSQDEARRIGAMALFGEKYGDRVRVVDIGEYSRELCGGTHVRSSAQLGTIKLLGESSIGTGVRRVEALVGMDAYRFLAREHVLLSQVAGLVKSPADDLPERIADLIARVRSQDKELDRLRAEAILAGAGRLADGAIDVNGISIVLTELPAGTDSKAVQRLVTDVRSRLAARPAVVAAAVPGDGKASIVVATSEAARDRGLKAGELVAAAAGELGGKGGGKPDMAQGGGSRPEGIPAALAAIERTVRERVAG
jgi:alanyl-tRNA synthetase